MLKSNGFSNEIEDYSLYEVLDFVEIIQCNKIKKNIYKALAYLDNETVKKSIEEDIVNINYSVALVDVMKEVDELLDKQYNKDNKSKKEK